MASSTGTRSPDTTETGLRRAARAGYRWLLLAFLVLGAVQIFLAGLGAFRIDNLGSRAIPRSPRIARWDSRWAGWRSSSWSSR